MAEQSEGALGVFPPQLLDLPYRSGLDFEDRFPARRPGPASKGVPFLPIFHLLHFRHGLAGPGAIIDFNKGQMGRTEYPEVRVEAIRRIQKAEDNIAASLQQPGAGFQT